MAKKRFKSYTALFDEILGQFSRGKFKTGDREHDFVIGATEHSKTFKLVTREWAQLCLEAEEPDIIVAGALIFGMTVGYKLHKSVLRQALN